MKIAKLTIINFLKIKDVELNPGDSNVIVGKNKQGKTSILKAIRAAFTGDVDSDAIRVGESKAEILIETEELTLKRTITQKGGSLKLTTKDDLIIPSPQKYLDGILGTFSFNPIEFFEKKAVDRKKYLLNAIPLKITQEELAEFTGEKLAGLDYSAHALEVVEDARKYYYDQRTAANAEKAKKERSLANINEQIPDGFDPVSVSDEHISQLRNAIEKDAQEKIRYEANQEKLRSLQGQEQDIKDQIAALTAKLTTVQDEIIKVADAKFDISDETTTAAAKETLASLEGRREIVYLVKQQETLRSELDAAIKEADKLDETVKTLTKNVPMALISKAQLPIEGLTFEGDEILINGVNIDNLSSSEQLRFGLQIVRSLNGEFKVINIDGIESLDHESFEFFLKEIENDDFQYFVTRVDGESVKKSGYEVIEIEDGQVKS